MANDDFDTSQKNTIWNNYFGSSNNATDVFGRNMSRNNFDADHIFPSSKGGSTKVSNGIPLAALSNQEKSDDLSGRVNGISFKVEGPLTGAIGKLYVNGRLVSK